MPDTGAPWNIPYVASTDLVSDWPTDSLALANAIDAGLDAAGNAGIGSNVVQAVKTDIFSTSSTSFTDVTDLTVTITPSSATAKVLVIVQLVVGSTTSGGGWRINGNGGATTYIGDAAGSRNRVLAGIGNDADAPGITFGQSGVYLASPNSTSAQTYKVEAQASTSSTFYVNRNGTDTDNNVHYRFASSITAIEVAA